VRECDSRDDLVLNVGAFPFGLNHGTAVAIEVINGELVLACFKLNTTTLLFIAVEAVVVNNDFLIDVEQGTVITVGVECPFTTLRDVDFAVETNSNFIHSTGIVDYVHSVVLVNVVNNLVVERIEIPDVVVLERCVIL